MKHVTPGLLVVSWAVLWSWCVLLQICGSGVQASLPELPSTQRQQPLQKFGVSGDREGGVQSPLKDQFNRLPGVCRRLRRRRITILCNMGKYCSVKQRSKPGHICRCPRGSKCSHFFLKSL